MLSLGRGSDEDDDYCEIIDEDTIFLLETLPGVKARQLKSTTPNLEDGHVLACLFFNLKWINQDSLGIHRDLLKLQMGERYRPQYSDFTFFIDPKEFIFSSAILLGIGSYGATYRVPWMRQRDYDECGNVTYCRGFGVLKIVASSLIETFESRSKLFSNKVWTLDHVIALALTPVKFESFYPTIGGMARGYIKFFGFTSVSIELNSQSMVSLNPLGDSAHQAFAFVFQYVSGGTIRNIHNHTKQSHGLRFLEDLCTQLLSVKKSLNAIHRKGNYYGYDKCSRVHAG